MLKSKRAEVTWALAVALAAAAASAAFLFAISSGVVAEKVPR
ncbi:hypothetical protein L687_04400 [Microbacterium maritypicum MF109]|uniref:Uncharacterized protein n=1 Tax=Microbacterium maritypicum MF109 TaxID=1333857 RepID=T5KDZ7_MICMQ|nr:hypothetical protein L687_04400 [Microbacterium maritypicum MF109]